jgi:hypothetical protein
MDQQIHKGATCSPRQYESIQSKSIRMKFHIKPIKTETPVSNIDKFRHYLTENTVLLHTKPIANWCFRKESRFIPRIIRNA